MEYEMWFLGVVKGIGAEKIYTSFQEASLKVFLLHLNMIYSFFLFLPLYSDCATETVCILKMPSDLARG